MSSKIKYKTSFQDDWLANYEFSSSLENFYGNGHCAKCQVYSKTISVSGQGEIPLELHAKDAINREHLPKPYVSIIYFQVQVKHYNQWKQKLWSNPTL